MKVSVIIVCYNYGRFLEEAVLSVLKQTFQGFEIIIVDPSSTDATEKVARKRMALDKRITYHKIPFGSIPESRNYGMNVACGDIFSWIDADDKMTPSRLQKSVDAIHDGADFVYGNCKNFGLDDEVWIAPDNVNRGYLIKTDKAIPCCTVSFSRNVFENVGYFDENLTDCEDYDYWIRTCAAGFRTQKINDILALRRVHESNRWNVMTPEQERVRLRNIVRKRHRSIMVS